MSYRKHTFADVEEAKFLRADGFTLREIAERVGASESTIKVWLDNKAYTRTLARNKKRKRRQSRTAQKQRVIKQMVEMRRLGASYSAISTAVRVFEDIDIGPYTVRNWVREAAPALPKKPRGVPFGSDRNPQTTGISRRETVEKDRFAGTMVV